MAEFSISTGDFVNLQISTSKDKILMVEKRYPKDITIFDLKNKLELITGANAATMKIELYTNDNKLVGKLENNEAMLGAYPVENNMRIHIVDKFLLQNEFDNLDSVPKYEISLDEYDKRPDTVKQFMMKNKVGHYNEEAQRKRELQEAKEKEVTETMIVGSRCRVTTKNAPTRLGTIMFKGALDGLEGFWVGIKLDEPLGRNDGVCKGKRYFECPPNYGSFVKAVDVEMGDFPEAEFDLDEEI